MMMRSFFNRNSAAFRRSNLSSRFNAFRAASTAPTFTKGPKCAAPYVEVPCRNRPYLPESKNDNFPEFVSPPKEEFPQVFVPEATEGLSIEEVAVAARETFDEHLHKYGAILLRKLPMQSSADFSKFVSGLGWRTKDGMDYLKCMSARSMTSTQVADNARTASDEPPEYTIEPHSEYHTVGCPPRIGLYCVDPPTYGGEWACSDTRAILKDLKPEVVEKFERLGVRYTVFYESKENTRYNYWEKNIAPTKEQAEEYLELAEYEWKWDETNALTYWKNVSPVDIHPVTGEKVWFNQIQAHHKTFYADSHPNFMKKDLPEGFDRFPVWNSYGDGTPIEDEVIAHLREVTWKHTVAISMKKGDMLMCDNRLAMHGRMGFAPGTPREIYVSCFYD